MNYDPNQKKKAINTKQYDDLDSDEWDPDPDAEDKWLDEDDEDYEDYYEEEEDFNKYLDEDRN